MTARLLCLTSESFLKVVIFLLALIKDSLAAIRPANMAVSHVVPRSTPSCVNNGK